MISKFDRIRRAFFEEREMKRSFYIILSGVITTTAVLGWCTEQTPREVVVPEVEKTVQKEDASGYVHYQEAVASMVDADDALWKAELMFAQVDDGVSAVLSKVTPEMTEADRQAIPRALRALGALEKVNSLAVVDLKNGQIWAGDAEITMDALRDVGVVASEQGIVHTGTARGLERISWQCMDETFEHCLVTVQDAKIVLGIEHDALCKSAVQSAMKCGTQSVAVDVQKLLGLEGCSVDAVDASVFASMEAGADRFDWDGRTWHGVKSDVGGDCRLVTVYADEAAIEFDFVADESLQEPQGGDRIVTVPEIAVACGTGLVMILLGFACTYSRSRIRREEENVKEERAKLDSMKTECSRLKKDMSTANREKESLTQRVTQLEDEMAESKKQYQIVCEEAESLKVQVQKAQLMSMTLEEEKRQLEDALASAGAQRTIVDNPAHMAEQANMSALGARVNSVADTNRITAPADGSDLEELASQEKSFFDAFADEDGWDDIAKSFDSIFTTKPTKQESATDLLENETASDESSFGMTNFLKEVREKRSEKSNSENGAWNAGGTNVGLKPVSEGIGGSTASSQSLAPLHNQTVSGLGAIAATSDKVDPVVSDPKRSGVEDDVQSFKPAPSWTGRSISYKDAGMDENSLYNALKRRAKDVSQMDMPAARTKSGAFEYNRGLSKSGVFSVTGSRVDIDPASDTEYFKSLYEKFVGIQRECGESTDKFTLEQFVTRLAREKERLIQTYHCRSVRFTVYAKDGKASLKATPQK